jgi:MFS family permease
MRQGLAAVDWLGVFTIVGGTLIFLLGLEFGGVTYPWNSATVVCLIVFGVLVSAIFVVIEWKVAKYPIIPMRLFKVRSNVASLAVSACHGFVFISASYYLPLYFQAVLGAAPLLSGVYALPFTISLAVVSSATGVFIRKTGKYLPCIIFGMGCMTLGWGLLIDLGSTANWAKIILFQLVAGIGVGPNFQSPLISLQ